MPISKESTLSHFAGQESTLSHFAGQIGEPINRQVH